MIIGSLKRYLGLRWISEVVASFSKNVGVINEKRKFEKL